MPLLWNGCAGQPREHAAAKTAAKHGGQFDGEGATLVLINQSAEPIRHISVAPSDHQIPDMNLLESGFLAVGQSADISGLPPGTWDIYIEDRMGRSRTYPAQALEADNAYSLIVDAYGWK